MPQQQNFGLTNWQTRRLSDVDESGNPTFDVTDPGYNPMPSQPMRTSGIGSYATQMGQNQPGGLQGSFMGNMPAQPGGGSIQNAAGQMDAPDYPSLSPQTSGPYTLPERRDMSALTGYTSVFDRYPDLAKMAGKGGSAPWADTGNYPSFMRAAAYGLASQGQRNYYDQKDMSDQMGRARILHELAGASSEDQQGLQSNTRAYDNVGDTYNKQRMLPYLQRTAMAQAQMREGGAYRNISAGDQINQMTPGKLRIQQANEGLAHARTGLTIANTDQVQQMTGPKVQGALARAAQAQAGAGLAEARTAAVGTKAAMGQNSNVRSLVNSFLTAQAEVKKYMPLLDDEDSVIATHAQQKYKMAIATARERQSQLEKIAPDELKKIMGQADEGSPSGGAKLAEVPNETAMQPPDYQHSPMLPTASTVLEDNSGDEPPRDASVGSLAQPQAPPAGSQAAYAKGTRNQLGWRLPDGTIVGMDLTTPLR